MKIAYPCTITPQKSGGYVVQFLDLEEAFTEGETIEECLFNAQEVLSLVIEQRLADGVEIPSPSHGDASYWVTPDATIQAAMLVRMNRKDRTLADLARALGTSWPSAQRLENPRHSPTLKQLERAAAALGKRLILSFEQPGEIDKESAA